MEKSDEIRYRIGSKEIYEKRKETIERNFGTAKEHHGMRYTQQIGREKMAMKVGLTFACLNMKKLARILCKAGPDTPKKSAIFIILKGKIEKMKMKPRKTPDDHTICPGFVYGLKRPNGKSGRCLSCIRHRIIYQKDHCVNRSGSGGCCNVSYRGGWTIRSPCTANICKDSIRNSLNCGRWADCVLILAD